MYVECIMYMGKLKALYDYLRIKTNLLSQGEKLS